MNELDPKSLGYLLNKLDIPTWPVFGGPRAGVLAKVISSETLLGFLEDLENRYNALDQKKAEAEEKKTGKIEERLHKKEYIKKKTEKFLGIIKEMEGLEYFLSLLPKGKTGRTMTFQFRTVFDGTPPEAFRLAYAGGYGAILIELCEMACSIAEEMRKGTVTLHQIPKLYRRNLVFLDVCKTVRDFWNGETPEDELKDVFKVYAVEAIELNNEKAVIKYTKQGLTETLFKDRIQKKIDRIQDMKMELRLRMATVIGIIAEDLKEKDAQAVPNQSAN
ncbi:MAG: hypothetical protein V1492_00400 [Candidatus Micrarchaeota archaeon]